jgi:hypothetical protein
MKDAWFAMETDPEGKAHEAYAAPLEGVPADAKKRSCAFPYGKETTALAHVDVLPGKASRLVVVLEAKPRPDGTVYLAVRAEDDFGNCAPIPDGELRLESSDPAFIVPASLPRETDGPFSARIDTCRVTKPGTYYLRVSAPQSGLAAESSFTSTELPLPIYFGDLHGHTSLSDGLGSGDGYFQHARNVSFCDLVSLTDHNRFDQVIIDLTEKYNEPGRFVTLFGRERGDAHGHRNFYSTRADIVTACGSGDLWECCRTHGKNVLMIPHHTNSATKHHWKQADFERYDPVCERLIEIVQNRGSFESDEIGGPVFDGGYGASARHALLKGRRFGFVGGSDTHRGQPGGPSHPLGPYYYRWRPITGITAAAMPTLTREDLWHALWDRRTYTTTGPRILLDFQVNGHPMGSEIPACGAVEITGFVAAAGPLAGVDIIRDGAVCYTGEGDGGRVARIRCTDTRPGEFYYLRARQKDDHHAYSSPVWVGGPAR